MMGLRRTPPNTDLGSWLRLCVFKTINVLWTSNDISRPGPDKPSRINASGEFRPVEIPLAVREREERFLRDDRPWISQYGVNAAARSGMEPPSDRAPVRACGAQRRWRGLQFRRASAGAAQDDAGVGGLFGRAESRRRSDTAVQEGVREYAHSGSSWSIRTLFIPTRLIYYFAMAKRAQPLTHSRIAPIIRGKERLAIWEKARARWKKRDSDLIQQLKKMRASWTKKSPSLA